MATAFKQQCPSCEAMVPIRDPGLIGRKIDCPTCKYRFVVDEPADEPDDEADAPKAKGKPDAKAKGAPAGKAAPAKTRPTGRRRDDDDEDERPKSSEGGSTKLVIGGLAGVVGIGLIAVAVYFAAFHDSGSTPSRPTTPSTVSGTPAPTPAAGTPAAGTPAAGTPVTGTPAPGGVGALTPTDPSQVAPGTTAGTAPPNPGELLSEITNLLPNETEGVIHVPFKNLLQSPIGLMALDTPGAFSARDFEARVGIRPQEIDRFVQAINFSKGWTYSVLRTSSPFDFSLVQERLGLKEPAGGGKDYLVTSSSDWVDMLLRYRTSLGTTRLGPLAVRLYNKTTLIFGDEEPVRDFIAAQGKFTVLHKEPYLPMPVAAAPPTGGGPATPSAPSDLATAGGGGGGVATLEFKPYTPPTGAGIGTDPQRPAVRPYFVTVVGDLKTMLDKLEERPVLASMAFDTRAAGKSLDRYIPTYLNLSVQGGFSTNEIQKGKVFGLSVHQLRNGLGLTAGLECTDVATSRILRKAIQDHGPKLVKLLDAAFGVKATVAQDATEPTPELGTGGGAGGPTLSPAGGGPASDLGIGGGGGRTPPPSLTLSPAGGSGVVGGQPGQTAAGGGSTIHPERIDRLVLLKVELVLDSDGFQKLKTLVVQHVRGLRGDQDMATGQSRWHEVGEATKSERDKKGGAYPRGTVQREPGSTRAGIPYPPNQRVSWMASLLPQLGHDIPINLEKSWDDKENLPAASMLISQFLDPRSPRSTWWVRPANLSQDVAATHIVGMAGLGVDAAEYRADDPNVKGKLGIFGYDRVTKLTDITDGAEHTIMMIQVPPTYKRPWLAGGGATVMGVPDTPSTQKSITPFVSTEYSGKKGTMAIMADGSVRFIPADVSEGVFKGMCTIAGGDEKFLDRDVPAVKAATTTASVRPDAPVSKPATSVTSAAWKEYVSTEGGFSILMPGEPKALKQMQKLPIGQVEVNVVVAAKGPAEVYQVTFHDVQALLGQNVSPELILDNIKAELALTLPGAKVLKEEKISVSGLPARDVLIEIDGKGQLRARIVAVKTRLYQALVMGTSDVVASADADKFLGSFKMLGK